MKKLIKNKIFVITAVTIFILVAYMLGKGHLKITSFFPIIHYPKTEETLDAWKTKWNNEVTSYCQVDVFSNISPEFQRAVSLVLQRYWESTNAKNQLAVIRANQTCLDIQYASTVNEMSGADGVFLFSKENSSPKGLKILVNPEYKIQDDLTTALLLSHELTHAEQFILKDVSETLIQECNSEASRSFCNDLQSANGVGFYLEESSDACVRKESQAFYNEIVFYSALKKVEQDNILLRADNVQSSQANLPAYSFLVNFNELSRSCPLKTATDNNNFISCLSDFYVSSQPFYQRQCGL